jgi:hypothetical protein
MKLFVPVVFGSGRSARIFAATGSMRSAGMRLSEKGWPVCGSFTALVKMPARSSAVATRPARSTPFAMRVPS